MRAENEDDSVPVLNEVVESGNESIIQSSRLGREVLRELQMLQEPNPVKFVLQDHILKEGAFDTAVPQSEIESDDDIDSGSYSEEESQLDLSLPSSESKNSHLPNSETEIEIMIDELVDRHVHALRADIRQLLTHLKHKP